MFVRLWKRPHVAKIELQSSQLCALNPRSPETLQTLILIPKLYMTVPAETFHQRTRAEHWHARGGG